MSAITAGNSKMSWIDTVSGNFSNYYKKQIRLSPNKQQMDIVHDGGI